MRTSEAARALGISQSRVLTLIKQGRLRATKRPDEYGNFVWEIDPDEIVRVAAIPRKRGWQKGRPRK